VPVLACETERLASPERPLLLLREIPVEQGFGSHSNLELFSLSSLIAFALEIAEGSCDGRPDIWEDVHQTCEGDSILLSLTRARASEPNLSLHHILNRTEARMISMIPKQLLPGSTLMFPSNLHSNQQVLVLNLDLHSYGILVRHRAAPKE
jgi:hypothetical protein